MDDNRTADGGRWINFDFKTLKVKIESQAGVEAANALSLCGTNSWNLDQEADVTTKAADLTCCNAQVPRRVANVYALENSALYLGTVSKNGIGEASRPTQLDRTQVYLER